MLKVLVMLGGWLQRWWGLAVFGGVLLALSGGGGHDVDGLAHARDGDRYEVPAPSRLVFEEATVGATQTLHRWSTEEVEVEGWVDGEGDAGVRFWAQAGGTARAEPHTRPEFEWGNRTRITLRAPDASEDVPMVVEVAFHDELAGNRFWKVVELTHSDWETLDLDLGMLRYDRGRLPRWEDVSAWGFTFRTGGHLQVRSFELWSDGDEVTPYLDVDRLRSGFPDPAIVRQKHRGSFVVLTDHVGLDLDQVLESLVEMQRRTQRVFPELTVPSRPVPVLVFATESDYRRFWDSYASAVGSPARPLREDHGYTWQGVATAWFSDEFGPVRPLYIHEASHALLERSLGLDAQRSWLFEGLGNVEQLEISQQDIARVYRDGLLRSELKMPIEELIDGRPIPTSRYWQATLLVEWMLADGGRTAALAGALADMRTSGSADLRPHLERHFGMDTARFSASFWAWAWTRYARSPGV
jgi:hypothetical protein